MKKFFTLVVLALLAVGCTMEYDDTGIRDLINGLDVRISKLENDISALQSIRHHIGFHNLREYCV